MWPATTCPIAYTLTWVYKKCTTPHPHHTALAPSTKLAPHRTRTIHKTRSTLHSHHTALAPSTKRATHRTCTTQHSHQTALAPSTKLAPHRTHTTPHWHHTALAPSTKLAPHRTHNTAYPHHPRTPPLKSLITPACYHHHHHHPPPCPCSRISDLRCPLAPRPLPYAAVGLVRAFGIDDVLGGDKTVDLTHGPLLHERLFFQLQLSMQHAMLFITC